MKASVSTPGLFMLAGIGLALILLDFGLARENVRARGIIAAVAFLLACSSLATLAWTSVGELRHPPKAPASRDAIPFGGPPPEFLGGVDPMAPER